MVTPAQRRRPRPWAIALGLIAVAMVPVLAVAAMAGSGGDSEDGACGSIATADEALVERSVLDVLPAGSLREVGTASDYDESCEFGGTEVTARWAGTATGAAMVQALRQQGWTQVPTGTDTPQWLTEQTPPSGAAGATNDNESPNVVLTTSVDGRDLDLAVDQEGLHVVLARVPAP